MKFGQGQVDFFSVVLVEKFEIKCDIRHCSLFSVHMHEKQILGNVEHCCGVAFMLKEYTENREQVLYTRLISPLCVLCPCKMYKELFWSDSIKRAKNG